MFSDNVTSAIKSGDFKSETGATPTSIKLSGITVDLTFDVEPASIHYTGSAMPKFEYNIPYQLNSYAH